MRKEIKIIFLLIFIFHLALAANAIYFQFSDGIEPNLYWLKCFIMLLFSAVWFGVYKGKTNFAFIYIVMVVLEFLATSVLRNSHWSHIVGNIFFPVDLIFVAVLLLFFKSYFGVLQKTTES